MWERFSYYGMRALLVLFMVDAVRGGMGLTDQVATAIYGLYTAGVYLAALPGGWVADRIIGARRAVLVGGMVIAAGHFVLAIPSTKTFYLGLLLIVVGTGLLKPNISALVGELYPEGGARRDAGFTIFYMGINIGATAGPLVCSLLGEKVNWHAGFAAAGIGMVFGVLQFAMFSRNLGSAGLVSKDQQPLSPKAKLGLRMSVGAAFGVCLAFASGAWRVDPVSLAKVMSTVIVGVAVIYFAGLYLFGRLDASEKKRIAIIGLLFLVSALFWAGFEQAGSSFNLFAERFTAREFASLTIPAGWFQSIGPILVITLAPLVAWVWVKLAARSIEPSLGPKFAVALLFLAAGFAVMAVAATLAGSAGKVGAQWLIMTYVLHTLGELCLSPVGLSSVTKLAPARLVGQMMGIWFLATSLGNLFAGLLAGDATAGKDGGLVANFMKMVWLPVLAAAVLFMLTPFIRRWSESRTTAKA